jgi:hypothetical protein
MKHLLLILLFAVSSFATLDTFKFSADTLWSTAANWSRGVVPDTSDTVIFTSASNGLCVVDINDTIKSFKCISGHTNIIKFKTANLYIEKNIILIAGDSISGGTSAINIFGTSSVTTANKKYWCYDLDVTAGNVTFLDTLFLSPGGDYTTSGSAIVSHSGYGIVSAGDVNFNSTGTHNTGNFITMNAASGTLHSASTAGTFTGTSTDITMNTGISGVIDMDKVYTGKSLIIGNGSIVNNTGTAGSTYNSSSAPLVFVNGGQLTFTVRCIFQRTSSGNIIDILGAQPTIINNATVAIALQVRSNNQIATIPKLIVSGSSAVGLSLQIPTASLTGWRWNFIDSVRLNQPLSFLIANPGTSGKFYFDTNYISATNVNFNNGTTSNANDTFDFGSSKWSVSGNLTRDSSAFGIIGTSVFRMVPNAGVTDTIISKGKPFWDFRIVGNATGRVLLNDSLQAAYFRDSSGKFAAGANTIRADSLYYNGSPDSMTSSGNIIVKKDFIRNTAASYSTGGYILFDTTNRRTMTLTANGAQLRRVYCKWLTFLDSAKLNALYVADGGRVQFTPAVGVRVDTIVKVSGGVGTPDSLVSTIAGSQARLWVPGNSAQTYMYWKDICVKGGTITCPWTSGCRSGGGGKCP